MTELEKASSKLFEKYIEDFKRNPVTVDTILLGQNLMQSVSDNRREKWKTFVENRDMTRNSTKAWNTLKQINRDLKTTK